MRNEYQFGLAKYLLDSGIDYKQKDQDGLSPSDLTLSTCYKEKVLDYIDQINLR